MSKYHETDREITDAINDGICTVYRVQRVYDRRRDDDVWIVYTGDDGIGVEAYDCAARGMLAVANTVRGLVYDTAAKTYASKSSAVAAVRRAETFCKHVKVAVRGDRVYVW